MTTSIISLFLGVSFLLIDDCTRCKADESGFIAGDYIIGALFPVHEAIVQGGQIDVYDGLQIVEAAFFAVDLINKNTAILPNITLGIDIRDDKRSSNEGVRQSLNLLSSALSGIDEINYLISSYQSTRKPPIIGIIGPDLGYRIIFASGGITVQVPDFLKAFKVVQVGYSGPQTHMLNNPLSVSVIPGNEHMTDAVVDILIANNWTYVSLVYSQGDPFGEAAVTSFKRLAESKGICIHSILQGTEFELNHGYNILASALSNVQVIVCYCSPYLKELLLFDLKRYNSNISKEFVVIGGDGWSSAHPVPYELQDSAVGDILISMKQTYIKEFDDYFFSRNLENNKRNPWFTKFWEQNFNCKFYSFKREERLAMLRKKYGFYFNRIKDSRNNCSGEEVLSREGFKQNPKVPYVVESVFVLAHGLHNMLQEGCNDFFTVTVTRKNRTFFNKDCYHYHVRAAKFDFYGQQVGFWSRFPTSYTYDIHNFQRLENGSYDYVKVGEYRGEYHFGFNNISKSKNGSTKMMKNFMYPQNARSVKSTCHEPCPLTHAKVLKSDKCCWDCVACSPLEVLEQSTKCVSCPRGFMSNVNKTKCVPIPMESIKWRDSRTILLLAGSILTIALAAFTTCVFVKYRHTPVVKASTIELCYIMLVGIFAANLTIFIVIPVPNVIRCAVLRTLPPISFTLIYAALVVKTNRIAETLAISKKKFPKLKSRFRPKAMLVVIDKMLLRYPFLQVGITLILVCLQVLPCSYSSYKYSIKPIDVFVQKIDSSYYGFKMCPLNENILIELFAYVGVLILFCTYYAVKTRNVAENYNEAKYIGFSMYATILTDIAFGWILTYVGNEVKVFAMTLCMSVNSLVVWILLFAPKLYIILWVSEKNTKDNFKTTANIRCFIGGQQIATDVAQVEMMKENLKINQKRKTIGDEKNLSKND